MPSFLSSTFTTVGNTRYNFEYIILAAEKQGATELNWTGFYTSVPGWDVEKLRPDDWLFIKMTEKTRIVYRPIQPFDLSVDPVSKYVVFTDYEPADRRSKFSKLRTLREITAGAWPEAPTPDETLIATQLDMVAIAKAAEEAETGRKLFTRTTAPSPRGDDAMSVDVATTMASTGTGTTTTATTTAAATTAAGTAEGAVLFSLTAMEAAIKKQVESTLVELIKKPDESTTTAAVVTAPVTTVASTATAAAVVVADQQVVPNNRKKKGVKKEKQQAPAAVPVVKPLTEGALALMRQEMRSELLREFEAKTEKQLQQHQQQLQQQAQQWQQQQQQQKQREAGFNGYRMRAYRRSSRSKSRSRTPPPPLNRRRREDRREDSSRKRSYSNERSSYRSRSRSRSRETKKESGNRSEPLENKAVELLRLGLEQMSQKAAAVSSSGEDKKQTDTSEMLLLQQQREQQFQLQQQLLEQQQQQMLTLQQQQQQLQRQLLVQKSTTATVTGPNRRLTGRGAHNTFHLPGPEPAMFLPLPKSKSLQQLSSSSRPPLPKRQDLDETYEGIDMWREPSSPDVTPERFHKGSAGQGQLQNQHYLWLQFQHQQRLQQKEKEETGTDLNGISRLKRS